MARETATEVNRAEHKEVLKKLVNGFTDVLEEVSPDITVGTLALMIVIAKITALQGIQQSSIGDVDGYSFMIKANSDECECAVCTATREQAGVTTRH